MDSDNLKESIIDHVEYAFDGDIQSKLQETIEEFCGALDDEDKEDLIESVCEVCKTHLTDPANMYLDEQGFFPSYDFCCTNWE